MKNFVKVALFLAIPLLLCAFVPAHEAPLKEAPALKLKIASAKGKTLTATMAGGTVLKMQTGKKTYAIATRVLDKNTVVVRVLEYNGVVKDMGTLPIEKMKQVKQGRVSVSANLSHRFPGGGSLNMGWGNETMGVSSEGCCTIVCDNGVVLYGCPVRSSCGSC